MLKLNSMKATSKDQQSKIVEAIKLVCKELDLLPQEVRINHLYDVGISDYSIRRAGGLTVIMNNHFNTKTKKTKNLIESQVVRNLIRKGK